jgi:hypothetical protein
MWGGKSEICKRLEKQQNCMGLIDEDPLRIQPSYIEKMEVASDLSKYELKLLHDKRKNNYIVVLCPRLEEWIVKTAHIMNIDMIKCGLPDDADSLHQEINANLQKFIQLIEPLKKGERLKTLKTLLK